MKLNKFDIGGEVISILTRGMYPDPRDAVREYIQNAVDAGTKNVSVKVRQSSVVIEDDGSGMDYETLRKAIRVGISDKSPKKNVGFMGIGIYSSFHLCDTLTIYTIRKRGLPLRLEMNFKAMRDLLDEQKELRLMNAIASEQLIDLQTLLEKQITLTLEGELPKEAFPISHGTRVELVGLDPALDDELTDFDRLANYLRDVVPLHFDKANFTPGQQIEETINQICDKHNAHFEIVNLRLQVNGRNEALFRPYVDGNFSNGIPQKPIFRELKKDKIFLGVAWGCLNSTKNKIGDPRFTPKPDKNVRGFILKKQGFSIGTREKLMKSFGSTNTHFDRYVGEVILVYNEILPNAARNDLEYSPLRTLFYSVLSKDVASYYNGISNKFQEETRAEELIDAGIYQFGEIAKQFNPNEDNPKKLIDLLMKLRDTTNDMIIKKYNRLSKERKADADAIQARIEELEQTIQSKINVLSEVQKDTKSHTRAKHAVVSKSKSLLTKGKPFKRYENLVQMLEDLDFSIEENLGGVLHLLDERILSASAASKEEYYSVLNDLKNEILNQDLA